MRVAAFGLLLLLVGCRRAEDPHCIGPCPSWSALEQVAGQVGGPGMVGGSAVASHFSLLTSLAADGAGHVYLTDDSLIRVLDLATEQVTVLAGSPDGPGVVDGVGEEARVFQPNGLSIGGGALYFSDTENHTLRKIDLASRAVTTLAGTVKVHGSKDGPGPEASFREPEGVALDLARNALYVADTDNHLIRRLDLATLAVTTLAGKAELAGNVDAVGTLAQMALPRSVVLDATGANLYFTDYGNGSVRRISLADRAVTTVGKVLAPYGIALDGEGLVVTTENRLVRLNPATGALSAFAGAAGQGFVDATGAAARFNAPWGLASSGGVLYVADYGNYVIRQVALSNATVGSADGLGSVARFNAPSGMVADADGALYVADTNNHLLRKVVLQTGEVTTLAGAPGQAGNVDAVGAAARFSHPAGLVLDSDGRLYVADTDNHSIRRVDLATGAVETLPLTGEGGFAGLDAPTGLALAEGRLFVSDSQKYVVAAVDLGAMTVSLLAGTYGKPGFADQPAEKARFTSPEAVAADGKGNLYVADAVSNLIRRVVIATGAVSTVAGMTSTIGTEDGIGSEARFYYPNRLAIDHAGNLLVSDSLNVTIRRVALPSRAVTTLVGRPLKSGVALGPLPGQLGSPTAIALTPDGSLAIASENSVLLAR